MEMKWRRITDGVGSRDGDDEVAFDTCFQQSPLSRRHARLSFGLGNRRKGVGLVVVLLLFFFLASQDVIALPAKPASNERACRADKLAAFRCLVIVGIALKNLFSEFSNSEMWKIHFA